MSKNYYEILGVEKTATQEEIKKVYRKKAMEHHPDRGGDAEKFKEINEAYSILGDESKRKQYDTFGSVGGGNPFGSGSGFSSAGFDVDLGDIFESFFGGGTRTSGRRRQTNTRGEDIELEFRVDLKTSIFGGKEKLSYEKMFVCNDCHGEGGEGKKTCPDCHGSGYVKHRQQSIFGVIEHTGVCENCNGTGETIEKVCNTCHGNKRIRKKTQYDIEIPAGIDNNMVIKIEAEGNEGVKGVNGDLYVRFRVSEEEKGLKRDGVNLYYDLEIDLVEAVLGTTKEINIPIIGKRTIKIDSGTQFGTVINLSGDGVKFIDRDRKGDLFINLLIKIPKKLSETERECFEKLAGEKKINVHNKKGILEKIFG